MRYAVGLRLKAHGRERRLKALGWRPSMALLMGSWSPLAL